MSSMSTDITTSTTSTTTAQITTMATPTTTDMTVINQQNNDTLVRSIENYRSFMFVLHEQYGMLLLHCTRKKNKVPHYQIPGGHVDPIDSSLLLSMNDTITNNETNNNNNIDNNDTVQSRIQRAGIIGATRELYEETGIDVRTQLDRIQPVQLYNDNNNTNDTNNNVTIERRTQLLINEYKQRLFYILFVTDHDFIINNASTTNRIGAIGINMMEHCPYQHIQLTLSIEHSGFTFERDPNMIYQMILLHSGGKVAKAFTMAYHVNITQFQNSLLLLLLLLLLSDSRSTFMNTNDDTNDDDDNDDNNDEDINDDHR